MNNLIEKLKVQIIKQLNLEDVEPEDINPDAALFDANGELGLDSIDALELIVLLDKEYGIKIKNQEEGKEIFHSLTSIANFILKNKD